MTSPSNIKVHTRQFFDNEGHLHTISIVADLPGVLAEGLARNLFARAERAGYEPLTDVIERPAVPRIVARQQLRNLLKRDDLWEPLHQPWNNPPA